MKVRVLSLFLVVALGACRDSDPADAPPVGHVDVMPAALAARAPTQGPDLRSRPRRIGTSPATQRGAERVRRIADARVTLDAAWNACDAAPGDDGARCRDEAVLAYDAAIRAVRDAGRVTPDDATPSGVFAGYDDLAVVQVTGTRG